MPTQIQHAIPQHAYFGILIPPTGKKLYELKAEPWEFINPKTNQSEGNAQLIDGGIFKLGQLPESYCLLLYGLPKDVLLKALIAKYPQLAKTQTVQFLLFKKQ